MTDTPYPLGRLQQHDPRSRAYAFTAAEPIVTVTWPRLCPIFDQGQTGSCTGQAMAGWLGAAPRGTASMSEADAVRLYSEATALDEFPGTYNVDGSGQDTGSSGLAVCKAAQQEGRIASYQHAFTFHDALAALQHGPIIVGVPWHERMFEPLSNGFLDIGGQTVGGHEFLIRGVSIARQYVTCDNSWSVSWGRRGRFRLRWQDLEALLADGGDATIPAR